MPTSDVGDLGSALEFLNDAVERRQPRVDQARVVAGAEEALRSLEQAWVVVTPLHALPGLEVLEGVLECMKGGLDNVVCAGHVNRPIRIGQAERLLGTQ